MTQSLSAARVIFFIDDIGGQTYKKEQEIKNRNYKSLRQKE